MDKKEADIQLVGELLGELRSSNIIGDADIVQGFRDHITFLDDTSIDVPSAYSFAACEYSSCCSNADAVLTRLESTLISAPGCLWPAKGAD